LILPPSPPEGRGLARRFLLSVPDLAFGTLFLAAWLDVARLGNRYGVDLMLLIEIEWWSLGVSLLTAAMTYSLVTDEQWSEKAKSLFALVFLCAAPAVFFAIRWHIWWPVGAYAVLLWNRLRVARAGASGVRRMRAPLREIVLYAVAALGSMWLSLPVLGAGEIQFRIADYPGWCRGPEALLPDELLAAPGVVTWCVEPHRALAAGAVYYVLTGLLTLLRGPYRLSLMWGWVRRDPEQ
jgi:hypothetical protein